MDSGKEKICKEISVYLDRIEELENGAALAVLLIDEGEEEYSGEFTLSTHFLPEDAGEGDYLTIKISRDENPRFEVKEINPEDSEVILIFEDDAVILPINFLPEEISAGEFVSIKISRDEDKTNAALDEARQLLNELE